MHLSEDERLPPLSHAMCDREGEKQETDEGEAVGCSAASPHNMYSHSTPGYLYKNESSYAVLLCVVRSSPNPASSASAFRDALHDSHQCSSLCTGIWGTSICLSCCWPLPAATPFFFSFLLLLLSYILFSISQSHCPTFSVYSPPQFSFIWEVEHHFPSVHIIRWEKIQSARNIKNIQVL